jgi:hypothetical protein
MLRRNGVGLVAPSALQMRSSNQVCGVAVAQGHCQSLHDSNLEMFLETQALHCT